MERDRGALVESGKVVGAAEGYQLVIALSAIMPLNEDMFSVNFCNLAVNVGKDEAPGKACGKLLHAGGHVGRLRFDAGYRLLLHI